jgi:hypothetical protein
VLVALALIVWFESVLLPQSLRDSFGDKGLLRFVIGILCFYTMFLVVERQRMETKFTQVLGQFKEFYEKRAAVQEGGLDGGKSLEAMSILAAALASPEADVVESAYANLKRLTGKDFGRDQAAWEAYIEATRNAGGPASG